MTTWEQVWEKHAARASEQERERVAVLDRLGRGEEIAPEEIEAALRHSEFERVA